MDRVIIIAEAGVNHNGCIKNAIQLIDAAVIAKADYIKFQSFHADKIVSASARKAKYQKENLPDEDDSQFNMLKKLELSPAQHLELLAYCNEKGIKFLSTAFDIESINFLSSLNLDMWKIPSGEITNYPYLKEIAKQKMPVVMSTGMCDMDDIANAVNVLLAFGTTKDKISVLHCNTAYPTPIEDVNLKAMQAIANKFCVKVGYSDHTLGIEIAIAAVALGASIIEKHFTLDRNLPGPDHKASLEPEELKKMIDSIRNVEKAISGSGEKKPTYSERNNMVAARKSIVASHIINKGDIFSEKNITVKRPGNGISPMLWDEVIGKKAIKNFDKDELIEL